MKRILTAALAGLALTFAAHAAHAEELRIGFQKYGTLTVLKARGTLEQRLKPLGFTVRWVEFPAGPQLLEGLNVGAIDFGTTGEAPPIFAQAAGARLVYVGNEPPAPASEAIVVPKNSSLKSVKELKGKKVALNKGSNVHFLLVKALEEAGLKWTDIQPVYLPPADARAAFERGSVEAWVIWDPFLAAAEKQLNARVLRDGKGLVANHQFFLAERGFAERNPKVLSTVLDELDKTDEWAAANQAEVVKQIAPLLGLPADIVQLAVARYSYGVQPVTAKVADAQQQIADVFHDLKLIPKPIKVKDALVPAK
ncbi:sulfonate ABC transporter substrate-binding protein [Chitiniphilus eburneus]|uniref:Putative aliphatic sulfonates-binding protein n=1 Tax=Chitiniphilus eburneus TaxID=2571148 RepID=A0A4U0Q140_9NEIS|nr:sulfonate ABC transporter substrate-binding protein [Chitiniphilus eburneus]TJZ69364.1 sulfonate ABC transporter substrate-binding protein [Chitiniphilus eburneus]